jgi:hypothetical protein
MTNNYIEIKIFTTRCLQVKGNFGIPTIVYIFQGACCSIADVSSSNINMFPLLIPIVTQGYVFLIGEGDMKNETIH